MNVNLFTINSCKWLQEKALHAAEIPNTLITRFSHRKHIEGVLFPQSATFLDFFMFTLAGSRLKPMSGERKSQAQTAGRLKSAGPSRGTWRIIST